MSKLISSSSELDLDRQNLEDYLPSYSIHDTHTQLRLVIVLVMSDDISPWQPLHILLKGHDKLRKKLEAREHVEGPDNNPLLIFPEGTCVNNHYTVMFKKLMTSWAVVCDVWYLEPKNLNPGETSIEFAVRVRDIIALRVGLKKVPCRPGAFETVYQQGPKSRSYNILYIM
ncbi:hypothetical protein Leryth_009695 [Lithospermum erythrorhizon]|nr:hypothetical protein Leryth_009695 [Lithospermum erythrorhizon]